MLDRLEASGSRRNGLGGFRLSTLAHMSTRRYHGRLIGSTNPSLGRMVVLSQVEAAVLINGVRLSVTHYPGTVTLCGCEPPLGLPGTRWDPRKELPFSVVFSLRKGKLQVTARISRFPAERPLAGREACVRRNWERQTTSHRYNVREDGASKSGRLLFAMISAPGEDALNGMKIDVARNLYVFGPGELCILSTEVNHLGGAITPRHRHNLAWADDGRTLYFTARDAVYELRLSVAGVRP